eukprot:1348936-Pyramimonas_sp.AAC.1
MSLASSVTFFRSLLRSSIASWMTHPLSRMMRDALASAADCDVLGLPFAADRAPISICSAWDALR